MYRNETRIWFLTSRTAQDLGYAEADPSADIDGGDVINKIILSNALAFDIHIEPNFPTYSMRNITKNDIDYLKIWLRCEIYWVKLMLRMVSMKLQ